jgi:hypothetical protein
VGSPWAMPPGWAQHNRSNFYFGPVWISGLEQVWASFCSTCPKRIQTGGASLGQMKLALPKSRTHPRGANQGKFWWDPPISLHSSHTGSRRGLIPLRGGTARLAALDPRRAEQAAGLRRAPGEAVRACAPPDRVRPHPSTAIFAPLHARPRLRSVPGHRLLRLGFAVRACQEATQLQSTPKPC